MSVFVDIAPDPDLGTCHQLSSGDEPRARHRWRARLTTYTLPLLSVVVFGGLWQMAASAGIWNQTFVPLPSTVWRAFVDVSTTRRGLHLDALTRERLQEDVRQVSAESGRTTVFGTHSADEAAFLGSRIVVLTRRPGQVALDIPVDLPRTGVDPDELRRSPEYGQLRAEVGGAVKAAAA